MTALTNSFEGGTPGTAVSAADSGGASGNAFDFVTVGSGATLAFDSTQAAHGLLSCKVATVAAASSFTQWNTSGQLPSAATLYVRAYFYFTGSPAATIRLVNATGAGGSVGTISLTSAGKLLLTYSSSGTTFVTFTAAVPLSTWFRVEGFFTASASAGQISGSLFTGDSVAATESHTSAANLDTSATNATTLSYASSSSIGSVGPYWMDDVAVSATGPVGPYTPGGGSGSTGIVAVLASLSP